MNKGFFAIAIFALCIHIAPQKTNAAPSPFPDKHCSFNENINGEIHALDISGTTRECTRRGGVVSILESSSFNPTLRCEGIQSDICRWKKENTYYDICPDSEDYLNITKTIKNCADKKGTFFSYSPPRMSLCFIAGEPAPTTCSYYDTLLKCDKKKNGYSLNEAATRAACTSENIGCDAMITANGCRVDTRDCPVSNFLDRACKYQSPPPMTILAGIIKPRATPIPKTISLPPYPCNKPLYP